MPDELHSGAKHQITDRFPSSANFGGIFIGVQGGMIAVEDAQAEEARPEVIENKLSLYFRKSSTGSVTVRSPSDKGTFSSQEIPPR